MKRRISAAFLALALCLGLAVPAFAADPDADKATPVKTSDITLSDVVITDKYEKAEDEAGSVVGCYKLGLLSFADSDTPDEYRPVNFYIVPDDVTITFHLSKDHAGAEVYALALKETEPQDGVKAYAGTTVGNIVNEYTADTVELDKEALDDLASTWDDPNYDLLACNVENGDTVWVMFESKLAALGDPEETDKPDPDDKPAAPEFTDVEEGAYYEDAVKWAVAHEPVITNGTSETTFDPGTTCTQVQILTFLYRAAGEPETKGELPVDIEGKNVDYAKNALCWAAEKKMIDETFDVTADCTRATAVSYIWQAFDKPEADKSEFKDVDAEADYAAAVDWAVANGVTNGTDMEAGEFSPNVTCTRGQIVTFLHRAYVEEARLGAEK